MFTLCIDCVGLIMFFAKKFLCTLFLLFALSFSSVTISSAQSESPVAPADFEQLIDSAKEKGLNVIVISPESEKEEAIQTGPNLAEQALKVRSELARIINKAPEAFSVINARFHALSPDGTLMWLFWAVLIALAGILIGSLPARFVRNWNKSYFEKLYIPDPKNRAEKIQYLLFRAALILFNVMIMATVAILIAIIFDTGHLATRATIGVIIGAYIAYRIFRHVILFNVIAPDTSSHRMINLSDEAADVMQRQWRRVALTVILLSSFFVWFALIGLSSDTLKLIVIICLLASALMFGTLAYRHRNHLEAIILGKGEPSRKPIWRRILASQAYAILIGYLVIAWVISTYRILLNIPDSLSIIGSPITALILAITIYSILLILIDRYYVARQRRFEERVSLAHEQAKQKYEEEKAAFVAAMENRTDSDSDDDEELIINSVMKSGNLEAMPVFKPIFKSLIETSAGILVTIFAIGWVLSKWNVNINQTGNPVTEFLDTLLILFVAWFLYRAVIIYIDHQLAEQDVGESPDGDSGDSEMGGQSASRIGTLLPLVRNVFIVTIIVLAFMIILSNAGVDIAPLFAGAGVIGLAVGFGSQALIRDIFSGGFFLFDDAFRKGEYIELGDIRGTVEKISLRSFQLRHHNGPLHTIPFGEIKQLTNYSRDWVMMKLPLRLTYDTDIERVRKLIKKLGQQLLEHKECGHLFLQPLKSQGVYKMEDSAMIIRVKFMTKPGDQFVTRKVVYAAIRDLFEREGIKFANKEVTVRLAEEPVEPLTDKQKQAISAAARSVVDEEAEANASQKPDDGL
jgi:small-conductance mechanosensitive channel